MSGLREVDGRLEVCVGIWAEVIAGYCDGVEIIERGQRFAVNLTICTQDSGVRVARHMLAEFEWRGKVQDVRVDLNSEFDGEKIEEGTRRHLSDGSGNVLCHYVDECLVAVSCWYRDGARASYLAYLGACVGGVERHDYTM